MEEELRRIGIDLPGEHSKDGSYIITIPDSNEYGRVYSKLENWPELDEDEDTSLTTHEMSSIQFEGDNYIITLIANLDDDEYKLVMKEY